jgi:hypothetical protein
MMAKRNMHDLKGHLTVLVNSTDTFSDCWPAFFQLFKRSWPSCPCPVVLNTETRAYSDTELELICSKTQRNDPSDAPRLSWGDCLIRCLEVVRTPLILYLQEDYFLSGPIDQDFVAECIDVMVDHHVAHIRLMEVDVNARYHKTSLHPLLREIDQRANYRVSLQAGLWNVTALRGLLRSGESAWNFERFGSVRAMSKPDVFLCQSLDDFNHRGQYPIPYQPTGIVRGKWYAPAVVELFAAHGISVDYSKRGFYKESVARKIVVPVRAIARRVGMAAIGAAIRSRNS